MAQGINDNQFRQLKQWMKESAFTCTDEWLVACVEWIFENYPRADFDKLKEELFEQWQGTNLEQMESSCLPQDLAGQRLAKLSGKFGLQINSIRDIGESSYSQFMKMKKLENENVSVAATDSNEYKPSWQPKPRRCLHLTMTDGTQKVFGMEMQQISNLSLEIKPGAKVTIVGPVECRRGIFHLKESNIKYLGGEVEELQNTHNAEKIVSDVITLARGGTISEDIPQSQNSRPLRNRSTSPLESGISTTFASGPSSTLSTNSENTSRKITRGSHHPVSGGFPESPSDPFSDDDDIFMEIDEQALIASAANTTSGQSSSSANTNSHRTSGNNLAFTNAQQSTVSKASFTTPTNNFMDDIEEYDKDDPSFMNYDTGGATNKKVVAPSKQIGAKSKPKEAVVSSNSKKPKSVFVPPLAKPLAKASSSSSSTMIPSSILKKKPPPEPSSLSTTLKNKSRGSSESGGSFKTPKSLVGINANSSNGGKQLNILQYMKPMPVVIDPPTPERRIKRPRRSVDESNSNNIQIESEIGTSIIKQEEPDYDAETERVTMESPEHEASEDQIDDQFNRLPQESRDQSLMNMVDLAVENRLTDIFENDDVFESMDNTQQGASSTMTFPVRVSDQPYVFIKQIQENMDILISQRKVLKVKACVSTVISNISIDNGSWTLGVCINDGTGYLNCRICSDVLNKVVGFTPPEMRAAKKTKEGKQLIHEALGGLQRRLVNLNAVIELEVAEESLIILNIWDPTIHHANEIRSRYYYY